MKNEIAKAAKAAGLKYHQVYNRVYNGMTIEEAVSTPFPSSRWTPEIKAFIRDHYKGIGNQELADRVNEEFGTSFTREDLLTYKKNHKLPSGLTGRFEKGHRPPNKGKKIEEFMKPEVQKIFRTHQFKVGSRPANAVPVGTEVDRMGYLWRKIAEPNVWKQVHLIIWEKDHGEVPPGYCVTFLDGNARNFSPENLCLITEKENRILNRDGLRFPDKDLTQVGVSIARLKAAAYERQRKRR